MAGARFDILFTGELLADADAGEVCLWLQHRFKLSDKAAERLFDGRTHTIKRNVNLATASHFREIFREAGALIEIRPVPAPTDSLLPSTTELPGTTESYLTSDNVEPQQQTRPAPDDPRPQGSTWEDEPLEQESEGNPLTIDTSHLSLVQGQDWTLEDCQPPLPPIHLPDISHLELVPTEPDDVEERDA